MRTALLIGLALLLTSAGASAQVVCQKTKNNGSSKFRLSDACKTAKGEASVMLPAIYTATANELSDEICTPLNVDVVCDVGDVVVGGGCAGTADQWYFRVNTRRPDEGWTCRAVRNSSNGCVQNTVTVSAICADLTPELAP